MSRPLLSSESDSRTFLRRRMASASVQFPKSMAALPFVLAARSVRILGSYPAARFGLLERFTRKSLIFWDSFFHLLTSVVAISIPVRYVSASVYHARRFVGSI